jgi:hypothetical protein
MNIAPLGPMIADRRIELLPDAVPAYNAVVTKAWAEMSILDRMVNAVEAVRDRLKRAATALEAAGVPYAVVGGNAVAAWVTTKDRAAVRNTQDVDILLRREDLDAAQRALESAGFVRRHVAGIELFLDGPGAPARDALHVVIANEKIRPSYATAAPDVDATSRLGNANILDLESLVRMKLTSFRRKDQLHLLDMLDVGLIDESWVARFPPELAERLQHLIDTPDE